MRVPTLLALALAATIYAAPPQEPGPALTSETEAAWTPLFHDLAASRTIHSEFVERRWFGFRKTPVILFGELRLDPQRGLSLHYTKPEERIVVMDAKGLLLREANGTAREIPSDPRAGGMERALLPALRFDLAEIRQQFVIHAAKAGADWRLDLEPKDTSMGRTLGNLIITGSGRKVLQLEFRRTATQRVEIGILSSQEGVTFPPGDLKRYFR